MYRAVPQIIAMRITAITIDTMRAALYRACSAASEDRLKIETRNAFRER